MTGCPAAERAWWAARAIIPALVALLGLAAVPAGADPLPPRVTAEAVLLLDLDTGGVLYAKNAEEDRAPASLVKLMTLYLAHEDLRADRARADEQVIVSAEAAQTARFRLGLRPGEVAPLATLLAAVAVISANDAAAAVAEHLAGSVEAFVARMNATAERMGLIGTVFANPHGLPDPRQRSTARDMAVLAQELLREFPESLDLLGERGFLWRNRLYRREIPLFRDPGGVSALKTGFTLEAGYNVAVVAGRAEQRLLCVVLGAGSRRRSFAEAQRLLKFGFGEPDVSGWRRVRAPSVRTLGR